MGSLYKISIEWLILIGCNFILIFLLFLISVLNSRKIMKMKVKYNKFMNGLGDVNIEAVLDDCLEKLNIGSEKNKDMEYRINTIERNMYYCVQKVGVVRYNAFDNVGSDLSYSIALLDKNDDGLIISSLYLRENCSTFAKPVQNSKSKYALSIEEIKAIDIAKKTSIGNKYTE